MTSEEIAAINVDFSNHEWSEKARYQIFDGADIDRILLSHSDILFNAAADIGASRYLKDVKIALVSSNIEARTTFQKYISACETADISWSFRIFDTLEEARDWTESTANC